MAVFTPKRFSGPALLANTLSVVYSVPTGRTAVLKQVIFNNTSASATTVTMHIVPNGGSAGTGTQIVSSLSISGASQIIWAADVPLAAGDSIQILAGTSNVVTATSSGIEIV